MNGNVISGLNMNIHVNLWCILKMPEGKQGRMGACLLSLSYTGDVGEKRRSGSKQCFS